MPPAQSTSKSQPSFEHTYNIKSSTVPGVAPYSSSDHSPVMRTSGHDIPPLDSDIPAVPHVQYVSLQQETIVDATARLEDNPNISVHHLPELASAIFHPPPFPMGIVGQNGRITSHVMVSPTLISPAAGDAFDVPMAPTVPAVKRPPKPHARKSKQDTTADAASISMPQAIDGDTGNTMPVPKGTRSSARRGRK
jgi:hypothetical protein